MQQSVCCVIDTFSSVFSDDSKGGRSVHCAVAQTGTVRRHMTTVNGINVELERTSCEAKHMIHPDVKPFADDALLFDCVGGGVWEGRGCYLGCGCHHI